MRGVHGQTEICKVAVLGKKIGRPHPQTNLAWSLAYAVLRVES